MQIEKWSHIFVLAAALILLLCLQARQWDKPGSEKPREQMVAAEMVASLVMDESNWLLPPYPEIAPVKKETRKVREIKPSALTTATSEVGVKKEEVSVPGINQAAAAAETSRPATSSSMPAVTGRADSLRKRGAVEGAESASAAGHPAAPAVAVKKETAGVQEPQGTKLPAKKTRSTEEEKNCEEVHREVVRLIKNYLDEQQEMGKMESKPVMLASTQGIGIRSIATAPGIKTAMLRPRYILGMDMGILQPETRMTPAPKMGMLSEFYLGYEFSRLLQMGVCVGYTGISWPAATPAAPKALYTTHLQVKVFAPEIAKIRPFVQVGAGGQLHAVRTTADSTAAKVSTSYLARSLSAGVGGEYKVLSRVALQVVAEYRWNSGPLNKTLRPQHKDHYWQVKAGLSLRLGGDGKVMDTMRSGGAPSGSVANL